MGLEKILLPAIFGVSLLVGCGDQQPGKGSSEIVIQIEDETLKKVEELIASGDHESAESILNSYKTEDANSIAIQHLLTAEIFYNKLKDIVADSGISMKERQEIRDLDKKIVSALRAAEKLNPSYTEKKWDMFLVYDNGFKNSSSNSTEINTLRTVITNIYLKDENNLDDKKLSNVIYNLERARGYEVARINDFIKRYEVSPEDFRIGLSMGNAAAMGFDPGDERLKDVEKNWKSLYDSWNESNKQKIKSKEQEIEDIKTKPFFESDSKLRHVLMSFVNDEDGKAYDRIYHIDLGKKISILKINDDSIREAKIRFQSEKGGKLISVDYW